MEIESWEEESHSGAGYWRGLVTGLIIGGAAALLLSAKQSGDASEGLAERASQLKDKAAGLGGSLGALSDQVQGLKDRVTELRANNENVLFNDDIAQSHFIDGDALALTVEDAEEIATEVHDEIGDETELMPSTFATEDSLQTDAVDAIPDELKEEA
jgi:gas vesicle protein